ncbi:MAG TPA: SgcJ/EcaC family oxidoreductase [Lysobacter sp.]
MNDEQQIRDVVARWMQATREGDAQAVLDLVSDDAVFLVAGRPPFGKAEFAQAMRQQAASDLHFDGDSRIEEIQVDGDVAFMRSHLTVRARRGGEPLATRAGYTLTVLRREDGRWRLARDANLLVEQAPG